MFHLYSWRNKQYAETTTLPRYSSLRPRSLSTLWREDPSLEAWGMGMKRPSLLVTHPSR